MANVITIDLQVKNLGSFNNAFRTAGKTVSSFNGGTNTIGTGVAKATAGLRSYTTANARLYAQQQRQYASLRRQGARNSSPVGLAGIGEMGLASKLGLAATAVAAFKMAVDGAASAAKSFNEGVYGGIGVSPAQGAAMDMSKRFSGIGTAEWQGIHEKVRGGGVAAAELNRQYGYHPRPGPYGDLNPAATADSVVRFLRDNSVSEQRKQRLLSDIGAPELAKYQTMSEAEFSKQKKAGFGMSRGEVANADSKEARFDQGSDRALSGFRPKAWAMDALDWISDRIGDWSRSHPVANQFGGPVGGSANSPAKKLKDSIDDLTAATRENTAHLKNGVGVGGGMHAGSMPTAAYVHQVMQSEANRQRMNLGGYRL